MARTTKPEAARGLRSWRQGDGVRFTSRFQRAGAGFRASLGKLPRSISGAKIEALAEWVVVTQTCDLIRTAADRPNVHLAPLRRLSGHDLAMASRYQLPRFAPVPQLGADAFADLDEIRTHPKRALNSAERLGPLPSPDDRRRFAAQIARHFGRPAFPDEFQESIAKLQKRILERHGKKSDEGSAVTAINEIRVMAKPDWDAEQIDVLLFVVVPSSQQIGIDGKTVLDEDRWEHWIREWQSLVEPRMPIASCILVPINYDEMTARTYSQSDPLDIEYVSPPLCQDRVRHPSPENG